LHGLGESEVWFGGVKGAQIVVELPTSNLIGYLGKEVTGSLQNGLVVGLGVCMELHKECTNSVGVGLHLVFIVINRLKLRYVT